MPEEAKPNKQRLLSITVLLALALLVFFFHDRIHFDWSSFFGQLRQISPLHVIAGVALIYSSFWLRSIRWTIFVSPAKRLPPFSLVGSQFIGFTAVALFGRLADLTRPYLIAKRTDLPIASQVAVYTIERMFDLGAAAILFSSALAVTPRTAPHHEIFVRAGIISLAGTAFLALFALAIRLFGEQIANLTRTLLGGFSALLAESVTTKILVFRHGLSAIPTLLEFAAAAALSLAMWSLIGESYVQTLHAFVQTPELATLPFSRTMLLMAASIGGSAVQLPIIGWFTQIALTAATMHTLYGAPIEAATACGAVLLIVNLLSIIPIGLLYARLEGTTLRAATQQSTPA